MNDRTRTRVVRAMLAAACVVMMVATAETPSRAQAPVPSEPATMHVEGSETEPVADRWWGVVGAIICGAEINLILKVPALGLQPALLAAGISGCALAALDIMTTK